MKSPLFSCIIPVKGILLYLREALESLESQGMGDDLEIIVQDGTTEHTEYTETVDVGDGKVKWFREADCGQSDALNKGFAKANGEWLFWLNADDVLLPGALKKVLNRIENVGRVEWIAGDTVYLDEKGIVKDVRTDAKWRPWFGKRLSVWTGGPSAFFKRSLWERLGGFDTKLKYVMDIDLWTRWAQAGEQFIGLGEYLWGFRMHDGSLTGSGANRVAQLEELAQVDNKYGVSSNGLWRNITRTTSILDCSWLKRKIDTAGFRGKHWSEIFR